MATTLKAEWQCKTLDALTRRPVIWEQVKLLEAMKYADQEMASTVERYENEILVLRHLYLKQKNHHLQQKKRVAKCQKKMVLRSLQLYEGAKRHKDAVIVDLTAQLTEQGRTPSDSRSPTRVQANREEDQAPTPSTDGLGPKSNISRSRRVRSRPSEDRSQPTDGNKDRMNTRIKARVVIEEFWATEPSEYPVSSCKSMRKLLDTIWKHQLDGVAKCLCAMKFVAPVFLLQETSTKVKNLRALQFFEVKWDTTMGYDAWFRRNVEQGSADTLLAEVHLRTKPLAIKHVQEALWEWDTPYYRLQKVEEASDASEVERVAFDEDEFGADDQEMGDASQPSTGSFFPSRQAVRH